MSIIAVDNAFLISPNPPKLLDQAREVIRYKHGCCTAQGCG